MQTRGVSSRACPVVPFSVRRHGLPSAPACCGDGLNQTTMMGDSVSPPLTQNDADSPSFATTALAYPAWPWQNLSTALAVNNGSGVGATQALGTLSAACFYFAKVSMNHPPTTPTPTPHSCPAAPYLSRALSTRVAQGPSA